MAVFNTVTMVGGLMVGIPMAGIDVPSNIRRPNPVGLDAGTSTNKGGDLPDTLLWGKDGTLPGGRIKSGESREVIFWRPENTTMDGWVPPPYAQFVARDDAICLASVDITWHDEQSHTWLGDWARASLSAHKPSCLWIDKDGNMPATGFSIYWRDLGDCRSRAIPRSRRGPAAEGRLHLQQAGPVLIEHRFWDGSWKGGYTPMHTWDENNTERRETEAWQDVQDYGAELEELVQQPEPVERGSKVCGRSRGNSSASYGDGNVRTLRRGAPHGRADGRNLTAAAAAHPRRSLRERTAHRVVISDDVAQHGARDLCASDSSLRPDFLNVGEGLFCRMADKTLWPVMELMQFVLNGLATRDAPCSEVLDWTSAGLFAGDAAQK
ncbi:hypothetical protein GGR56DRAFT_668550 [Xylariaceae sp. FL0804]|nr:hypothetical protein GGR56DRAFT_668550 [Xylariaceae sp. FL0804]